MRGQALKPNPLVIGIGGVSRSGKTSLAKRIASWYADAVVLHQDDFIVPESQIPRISCGADVHIDWEVPESIDFKWLQSAILAALARQQTVVVEGLFAFHAPEISALYDRKIFLHISQATFKKRKAEDLRWGKEPDWYIAHIWNAYLKYGTLPSDLPHVLHLSGEQPISEAQVRTFLQAYKVAPLVAPFA